MSEEVLLEVKDLKMYFENRKGLLGKQIEYVKAVDGVSFTINRGETIGLVGESGCGKSTTGRLVNHILVPDSGEVWFDGKDISTYSEDEMVRYRRDKVGFVWQKSAKNLFPYLTVLQNVEAVMMFENSGNTGNLKHREIIKKRKDDNKSYALKLLKAVGLQEHKDKLPAQLSGGEQQRAAIAVALANKPDILLADEPTGAVDTRTADTIYELFHKLNKELGITIIIVTHDMALAGRVDRTVLISDGKVSTEKLKKHPAMEYTVLDKAHRIKLTDEMLEAAGIESNKVRVDVQDGRLVISRI